MCFYRQKLLTWGIVVLLAVPSLLASDSGSAYASIPHGQVLTLQIMSRALHEPRTILVYLPPGYNARTSQNRRYPVLYLLSGAPGSARDWFHHGHADQAADRLIDSGIIQPLILVSPDGNGGAYQDTQFIDSYDGRKRVETFITHDVLSYVDDHFRTIRVAAARGIAGYSAGAYGALNMGLHHPDLFGTLAGFCGYYTADPREVTRPSLNNPFGNNPSLLRYNSPSVTITLLHGRFPHIFLIDTTNDGIYTVRTRTFDAELTHLSVPHTTIIVMPRTAAEHKSWPHSWSFVAPTFSQLLPAIARSLGGHAS